LVVNVHQASIRIGVTTDDAIRAAARAGNDILIGGLSRDVLIGEEGNDSITGDGRR
jgi:Ca2+-binding RTX toxin-like protein